MGSVLLVEVAVGRVIPVENAEDKSSPEAIGDKVLPGTVEDIGGRTSGNWGVAVLAFWSSLGSGDKEGSLMDCLNYRMGVSPW